MLPLPKSGDLSLTANYRRISLSPMVAKLVNKMILNRLQQKIDKHLRPNQNGFRPGLSTTSHILALRRLIEGVRTRKKSNHIICTLQEGIRFHTQMHGDENSESV